MIAVYLRVSSRQQKTDAQRPDIERWLKGQRIKRADVQWFEDKETGKTLDRPAFENLRTAIFNGEVKTVVVWKLDRLSRRQRDGINILADWCEQGVRVVSVTQQLDLSGSVGRIVADVIHWHRVGMLKLRRYTGFAKQASTFARVASRIRQQRLHNNDTACDRVKTRTQQSVATSRHLAKTCVPSQANRNGLRKVGICMRQDDRFRTHTLNCSERVDRANAIFMASFALV